MEKKQEQQQSSKKSKRSDSKAAASRIFGANALKLNEDGASHLVGSIIEKGIASTQNNVKPIPTPNSTVLPFPVARHRSHGPHWNPTSSKNNVDEEEDADEDDNEFAYFNPVAAFAEPVQRKEKKCLDFSRWKELIQSDDSSMTKERKSSISFIGRTGKNRKDEESNKTADRKSVPINSSEVRTKVVASMEVDGESCSNPYRHFGKTDAAMTRESGVRSVTDMDVDSSHCLSLPENVKTSDSDNFNREPESMAKYREMRAERTPQDDVPRIQIKRMEKMDSSVHMVQERFNSFANEQGSMFLESEIDAENRARLESMSPEEIAEAQAEIMEKMNPSLLNLLKKRGQEKLNKQKNKSSNLGASGELGNTGTENQSRNSRSCLNREHDSSQMVKGTYTNSKKSGLDNGLRQNLSTQATNSNNTKTGQENGLDQNLSTARASWWNAWSARVEAIREVRFSLDGTVVEYDDIQIHEMSGETSVNKTPSADNVAERDFLRTDGDPGAAGYSIKEAVVLSRSVVPGQRVLALHLLASVLDKALQNIHQKQVGCFGTHNNVDKVVDWEALWAYALGPEPELVLSLRISLDDYHNSVVLACAKVIQCILSCNLNDNYFGTLEKTAICGKDLYTAPIFRSKPEIDEGFLHGGYWKYSAKPSNILPFSNDMMDDETEGKHTISDDIVVAGQDFAAGLVRMGILPRIRYILETEPTAAMEECMLSILIAIARHSPTCADAIMKCQRLVQTVVHRFTVNNNVEVSPSKIKSVCLFKVLARSDRKNCLEFISERMFNIMTLHLYQSTSSLDQWLKMGREKCKLLSGLIVEQLRLWKACIQSGYCVSYFSSIFPALCLWLNPPTIEKVMEVNVLSEFASISMEAYLVLEALAGTLPNFYSQKFPNYQSPEYAGNDVENWSWSHVGPMVDLAIKWISMKSRLLNWQNGIEGNFVSQDISVSPLVWVYSAVMRMLSRVLERVIPDESVNLDESGTHLPWLPEFVPKIGLEIIKSDLLSFTDVNSTGYGTSFTGASSFIKELCQLRQQGDFETSLASVSCLNGLVQVVSYINNLIQLAKAEICRPRKGYSFSREENILAGGLLKRSLVELECLLNVFTKLVASEWYFVQSAEIFSRGGPAPGVGFGWGAPGGGFWSTTVLLAENDARLVIELLEIFHSVSIATDKEMTFTMHNINSALGACLIAGPRDVIIIEKALDIMLQVPVLKCFDLCIRNFLQLNNRLKVFGWEYNEEDYLLFSAALASHFRNRWLSIKRKSKPMDSNRSSKATSSLETIPEDADMSNTIIQDHCCTSLVVEWAHQRLPLPIHWFLSPISTLCDSKHAVPQNVSNVQNHLQHSSDILEVPKAGIFFLLGVEAMSHFLSPDIPCPVQDVPLIWKLHSLSVGLLVGMGILEDEKSRGVFASLQELYGQLLDEARSNRNNNTSSNQSLDLLPETGYKCNLELLRFQSEIHESYSTFIDTLVEQFASVSYGDLIFGRQVAVYLHRCTEFPVRLSAWKALSNAHVLELLPPLEKCFGEAEGYLEPFEDNEGILEAYVKSWVSGALDRAATRGSIAFQLVLHHLSSFIFLSHANEKLLLRNRLINSLLRDYSQKQRHQGMMLDLIRYNKPSAHVGPEQQGSLFQKSSIEERFEILKDACEGNSSLLREVEKLKVLL